MPATQDKVAAAVVAACDEHDNQCATHLADFAKFEKYWRGIPDTRKRKRKGKKTEGLSNTFEPEFFRDTESVVSVVMAYLFSDAPCLEITPYDLDPVNILKAFNTQALIEKQLDDMDIEVVMEPIVREIVRDGTGVGLNTWESQSVWLPSANAGPDGGPGAQEVQIGEGPTLVQSPIVGFHFYPWARDFEHSPFGAMQERVTKREVNALAKSAAAFLKKLNLGTGPDGKIDEDPTKDLGTLPKESGDTSRTMNTIRSYQGYGEIGKDDQRVEIIDWYGEHPIKTDSPLLWRIVVANRVKTVVEIPYPCRHGKNPLIVAPMIQQARSVYGLGIGHGIWQNQKEINDFIDLGNDMLTMQMYNQWLKKGGSGEEMLEMDMTPLKVHEVDDVEDFKPLRPPIEAINILQMWLGRKLDNMRYTSAATHTVQGMPTDTTATEFKGIQGEAGRRLLHVAKQIAKRFLVPLIERMMSENVQFLSGKVRLKVLDRYVMVGKEDLLERANVKVRTPTDLDFRPALLRRATSALETILQVSQAPTGRYNVDGLVAYIVKTLGIDPRMVIPDLGKPGANGTAEDLLRTLAQREQASALEPEVAPAAPESEAPPAALASAMEAVA
jgi:hypothetical protein